MEFSPGVIGPNLVQDAGDHLSWLSSDSLSELLFELNHLADPRPIGAFVLDIDGDKFQAAFDYNAALFDGTEERFAAAVKARFGDKPIIYPPPPSLAELAARARKRD